MKDYSILIDDGAHLIELTEQPILIEAMQQITKQIVSEKTMNKFVKKYQKRNVKNLNQLILASKIPIYFYALLNSAEKHYDWYIIDTAFNQMIKDKTLTFDRVDDWFAYNTIE